MLVELLSWLRRFDYPSTNPMPSDNENRLRVYIHCLLKTDKTARSIDWDLNFVQVVQ